MDALRRLLAVLTGQEEQESEEDLARAAQRWLERIEASVRDVRRKYVETTGAAKRARKEAERLRQEAERWERRAALALEEGDEELARDALRSKLRAQREAERHEQEAQQLDQVGERLRELLQRAEQRVALYRNAPGRLQQDWSRRRGGGATGATGALPSALQKAEEAERRLQAAEAELELEAWLGGETAELEARFAELERRRERDVVDDELEELKRRLDEAGGGG